MRLLIFWDSITEWLFDLENWGWANRLKTTLWKKNIDVANCGISAYTTSHILNMFNSLFNAYSKREPWKEKETIILFSIGINDSSFCNGSFTTSKKSFQENLYKLYDWYQKEEYVKNVFFTTCINCDESKTTPVSWREVYYKNEYIQKYNTIIKDFCAKNNTECLDLYGILENSDFFDGLHPNANWHKKIFEKVYEFLEEKI